MYACCTRIAERLPICVTDSRAAPAGDVATLLFTPLILSRSPQHAVPKEPGILPAEQTAQQQSSAEAAGFL